MELENEIIMMGECLKAAAAIVAANAQSYHHGDAAMIARTLKLARDLYRDLTGQDWIEPDANT